VGKNVKKQAKPALPQPARQSHGASSLQRRLWGVNIAICVIIFFALALYWLAVEVKAFPEPGARTVEILEFAEICAITVFAIELYSRYRKTPDKRQSLAQNWLAIIAILPLGIIFRATRVFESVALLRPLAGELRLAEAEFFMPAIAVSSRPLLALHRWLANYKVFADFFSLASAWARRLIR